MEQRIQRALAGKSASQGGLNLADIKKILAGAGYSTQGDRSALEKQLKLLVSAATPAPVTPAPVTPENPTQEAAMQAPAQPPSIKPFSTSSEQRAALLCFDKFLRDNLEEVDSALIEQILHDLATSQTLDLMAGDHRGLSSMELTFDQQRYQLDMQESDDYDESYLTELDHFLQNYLGHFANFHEVQLNGILGSDMSTELYTLPPPKLRILGVPLFGQSENKDQQKIVVPPASLTTTIKELYVDEIRWYDVDLLATFRLPSNLITIKLGQAKRCPGSFFATFAALDLMLNKFNEECPNFQGFEFGLLDDIEVYEPDDLDRPALADLSALNDYISQRLVSPGEKVLTKAAR